MKAPPENILPSAIVAERERLLGWSHFMRAWQPILDGLCKTTAWKQLRRRNPVIDRSQLIGQTPKWCGGQIPDEKWSDRDVAMRTIFLNAFSIALEGEQTMTAAERKRLSDSYLERAVRLRNEAYLFGGEHHWAMLRAAAWCEVQSKGILRDEALTVGRHQGPPHVRAFCMRLAEVTHLIYGDVLRGAVAAIATAALGHNVTISNVRYWCENKGA